MADNEDIFDSFCFGLLCVTSLCILFYQSNFDTFLYLSIALVSQSQYGLWNLVIKGVTSDAAGFLAQTSDLITYYFNLPLIAAQTCLLSLNIKSIDGVSPATVRYLSMAPAICIVVRMLSNERPYHAYINDVVKLLSLGFLVYVTYELEYPVTAALFGIAFYMNEKSQTFGFGHDRATILAFNSVLYTWWLSNMNLTEDKN